MNYEKPSPKKRKRDSAATKKMKKGGSQDAGSQNTGSQKAGSQKADSQKEGSQQGGSQKSKVRKWYVHLSIFTNILSVR